MTSERWWTNPDFCERRVLPVVAAFCAGVIVTVLAGEAGRSDGRERLRDIQAELAEWRNACRPLLTLPPRAAPMVFGAAAVAGAARYQAPAEAGR